MPSEARLSRRVVAWAQRGAVLAAGLLCAGVAGAAPEDWARLLREDRAAGRPWPVLSGFEPALADTPYAYEVQRSVAGPSAPWTAWRALFASPRVAQQFQASMPAYARLGHGQQLLHPPYVVRHAAWQRPVVELGLAARLAALPAAFPTRAQALERLVIGWSAMVVVADVGFAPGAAPRMQDHIAVNGGGEVFMTGPLQRRPEGDLGALRVNLARDGRQLAWGRGDELPGGPVQALAQLLNELAAAREPISAEQIFFTGALGRATVLAPGRHVADFGSFGRIEFESRRITTPPATAKP